ncbi:Myomesin-2 [Liparis tanakae]|uniref:Myomesin-2 n=1 Tax=Liparis tanakae TaxID=230148 RepID=A0A4Z2F1Z5_9TELE|nr:Myomesin-2 [Liparis tanakae]
MVVVPDLPNLPPLAQWFRDDTLLTPGQLLEMTVGGGTARLTLPHLAKDDEGLYTLRVFTKDGTEEHSAYLFVSDAAPPVAGAPGAPMSLKAFDVNADFVLLAWKPPNAVSEAAVSGYLVDRRESGSDAWLQCTDAPVKVCKYPVHGLEEGRSYHFRVRAVNSAGVGRASRETGRVLALDAAESERLQVIKIEGKYDVVIRSEDLEGRGGRPGVRGRFVVHGLTPGESYTFRVQAANVFGLSEESQESSAISVEPALGPAYNLSFSEVRGQSLVLLWKVPVYTGASAVTGYLVDMAKKGSSEFTSLTQEATSHRYLQVSGLEEGETYVFRVRAVNAHGAGRASELSEPVCARALPGTQEIVAGVDEVTGDVFLSLEACEICETSKFVWSKNYKAIGDCPRAVATETGRTSRLTFTNPDKDDLGRYSVVVTDTDGVSSSQTLTEDALNTMLELSYAIRHPVVPLKHGLNYEILEKGHVRFWLQAVKLTPAVSYRFIVNDKEVKTGEVQMFNMIPSEGGA